jgi:cyclopropane-fatty-acyl-phospholipid synthase
MAMTTANAIGWVEQGLVPDAVVRAGIRRLLKERLTELCPNDCEQTAMRTREFVAMMDRAPIAVLTQKANEQHYEVPAAFFDEVLGPRKKYSCCAWEGGVDDLAQAEQRALRVTCERANLRDGMHILELGCGWGALTLYMAERYPNAAITAVSNSHSQRVFIVSEAARRKLVNVEVITADMNDFDTLRRFHRVVSLEMFEHMRNYRRLFARVSGWLVPGGGFFMHIFCHRHSPYVFEDRGPGDWMSRHFFSGGIMPSDDLPLHFQDDLKLLQRWRWNGKHYERTLNAWLERMDRRRERIMPILEQTYGKQDASIWWVRWRIFFMACAELFGYADGNEWWVSHYLFERPVA